MAKLSDNLRQASFRGVPFQVDDAGLGAGRRTQLHEYPQRDKPWVEDLGRAARELTFDAFVIGPDYVEQANRLLAALEEAGPGSLVHPWFGTLTVSVSDKARVSFRNSLGYAQFSLSFVESGELTFPAAGTSTAAQSRLAASGLEDAALTDFSSTFKVDGFQDFVAEEGAASVGSMFDGFGSGSVSGLDGLGFTSRAGSMRDMALGLLGDPAKLGLTIVNFLGVSSYTGTVQRWAPLVQALLRLTRSTFLAVPPASPVYTPSRQQAYTNSVAVNALARQVVLAQAVGASSLVPAAVYDDNISLRNQITAALDAETLNASDKTFTALTTARNAVWRDMTDRTRGSARLTTITPVATEPALVVAYDFYEDATREGDIVTRNAIRHPGFVPPAPLKVLTR